MSATSPITVHTALNAPKLTRPYARMIAAAPYQPTISMRSFFIGRCKENKHPICHREVVLEVRHVYETVDEEGDEDGEDQDGRASRGRRRRATDHGPRTTDQGVENPCKSKESQQPRLTPQVKYNIVRVLKHFHPRGFVVREDHGRVCRETGAEDWTACTERSRGVAEHGPRFLPHDRSYFAGPLLERDHLGHARAERRDGEECNEAERGESNGDHPCPFVQDERDERRGSEGDEPAIALGEDNGDHGGHDGRDASPWSEEGRYLSMYGR